MPGWRFDPFVPGRPIPVRSPTTVHDPDNEALGTDFETVDPDGGLALDLTRPAGVGAPPGRRPALPPTGDIRRRESLRNAEALAQEWPTRSAAQRDALSRRLLAVADMLSAAFAFAVAIPLLGHDTLGVGALLATPAIVLVCKLAGLYDRDQHILNKTTLDEAPALFRVAALYTLLAFLAGDTFVVGHFGPDQALVLWGLLFLSMLEMRFIARRIAGALAAEERCLVLGDAETADWLVRKLERSGGIKIRIVGRIPLHRQDEGTNGMPLLGGLGSLEETLADHTIDRVVVAPGPFDTAQLLNAVRVVKRLGVRMTIRPSLLEVVGSAVEFDEIEGATLLGVRRHGLTRSSQVIKRAFDLLGASFTILVLAPLIATIAIAIKLDSRGPVLFRQRRVGRTDEVFEMLKFRTMVDGAHTQRAALANRNEAGGGLFKIEQDPRVTRVGRFLRRTSLDELPQLLNVLRGQMSLVGPRPLVVDEDDRIEGCDRHRLLLPPGMTGLWQIFGSARIPLDEMVKIDYLYGANWSLWLDIKVLLRTVPFVVGRRGL
jgi:exopolysaccharide biosynthesis polyprenyl glycosylphosphotransferase